MSDDYLDRLRRLLRDRPDVSCDIEERNRHRAIKLTVDGQLHTLFIPRSPSDRRGPIKFQSDVRRILRGQVPARTARARGGVTPAAAGPTTQTGIPRRGAASASPEGQKTRAGRRRGPS